MTGSLGLDIAQVSLRYRPLTPQILCVFGASFPFKIQEKGLHKEFRGGGGVSGAPKFFALNFFAFFFFLHMIWCIPEFGAEKKNLFQDTFGQSSYPAEVRKWKFSPFFSAKGVVKLGVKFWWNFPHYVFQGLGVRRKLSPKFHVKNDVKNGKSGPKKPWQPQTWQDLTRFSPLDFSLLSPDFGGLVLQNYTENLEKKQKIQWRASSGDGAPKLQISVPCRGRTCPEKISRKFHSAGAQRWRLGVSERHFPCPIFLNSTWWLQQPRNYDFRVSQFNLPRSQGPWCPP